jgi:hypothetical protein
MFSPDVVSLRQFYSTKFGESARRVTMQAVLKMWPELKDDSLLGVGYTSPYLDYYLEQGGQVMVCMPAYQGAAYWPPGAANRVCITDETALPFQENSVNRVLMVHSVENSEQLSLMMSEIWRVLTPGGRVLMVVPNRLGLWSHFSNNPFGSGRPFSMTQMRELMSEHEFSVLRSDTALFMPPLAYATICGFARWFEKSGSFLFPILGGLLLVEAEKQIYAPVQQPLAARRSQRARVAAVKPAEA